MNPFLAFVPDQQIAVIEDFELEGHPEQPLPFLELAYKTWGKLNEEKSNVLVICHALTGSSDVEDW